MNVVAFERAVVFLATAFGVRAWTSYRTRVIKRREFETRLVDGAVLEAVFTPRKDGSEDADLLAEMRDTLAHLNRRAYAEEFWGVTDQLATLYDGLDEMRRETMRRAVVRCIGTDDRWLQLIGARTAARLGVKDAIEPIEALVSKAREAPVEEESAADKRWREELEEAMAALRGSA